jgi:hypothetical protein
VTGSRSWIDETQLEGIPGYLGIELKGSDLSRRLRSTVDALKARS